MDAHFLVPKPTDRAFFVGQTGSGKTTLARELLKQRRYKVVLDTKGLINWEEYRLIRNFNQLGSAKEDALIWRPSADEMADEDAIDRFFHWIYSRGNTTCYVDEAAMITESQTIQPHYYGCITRGREHGVEMWSGTQRPVNVPNVLMSEAEHIYCFYLKLESHREKVFSLSGIESDDIKALPKHNFYYAPQDDKVRGPLRLRLN